MPPLPPVNPGKILSGLRTALLGKGVRGAQSAEMEGLAALRKRLVAAGKPADYSALEPGRFMKWIETADPASLGHYRTPPGQGSGMLRSLLVGNHGLRTLKGRYHTGGLLGKGGLLRGELAWSPEVASAARNIRHQGLTPERAWALARAAPGDMLSKAFILGFPAYGIGSTLATGGDPRYSTGQQIGRELGSSLGWALTGPLGALGFIPGTAAGESIGEAAGGVFDPQSPQQRSLERQLGSPRPTPPARMGGLGEIVRRSFGAVPE